MQTLPFEKNRYYYGKMLTSGDFQAEQKYINGKRNFLNSMLLGNGVLCGLGVLNLDDLSILVESGAAIDSEGREIIVDKSVVKKVYALPGFQKEDTDCFSLCLRYHEEETQPVYAVNRKEGQNEYENNRIKEGYELFLIDKRILDRQFHLDSEFFVETELFSTKDYRVVLRLPAIGCKGRKLRISIESEKKSNARKSVELAYDLQMPVFLTREMNHCLEIRERIELSKSGEKERKDYWVFCSQSELKESSVLILPVGQKRERKELELKVRLTRDEPEELIRRELGKMGLEFHENFGEDSFVRLADLYMRHTDTACVIRYVDESVRSYIPLPSGEAQRNLYMSYYDNGEWTTPVQEKEVLAETPSEERVFFPEVSCGTLEIPLAENMRKGAICYSSEIVHGLGPGNVCVITGLDETEEGVGNLRKVPAVIYGDAGLFAEKNPNGTSVETAVKVWKDRGSFQVAAQVYGEQNTVLLTMHWIAWKYPQVNKETEDDIERKQGWIAPAEAAVNLKPGGRHFFRVNFHNMQPCTLKYEVTEEHGGKIKEDGTYTAPRRTGVYEVKISCEEYPEICTYVYAVVV